MQEKGREKCTAVVSEASRGHMLHPLHTPLTSAHDTEYTTHTPAAAVAQQHTTSQKYTRTEDCSVVGREVDRVRRRFEGACVGPARSHRGARSPGAHVAEVTAVRRVAHVPTL